jgi:hypothetical protein
MEVHDPPNRTSYVNSPPFGWPHRFEFLSTCPTTGLQKRNFRIG